VFEKSDKMGGLLRYGIPDFKLEKRIIDRRLAVLEAEGIFFRAGVDVGGTLRWDDLNREYDAVLIAIGAGRPRELEVLGREMSGVMQAMDFLEASNRGAHDTAHGKRVIILGGGDTGSDCLGTALRQGAKSVQQVELFPAPPSQRAPNNPWPQWPVIFRISSSQDEGGDRRFALMTQSLSGVDGKLTALQAVEVKLEQGKWVELKDREHRFDVDLLLLAMGFLGPDVKALSSQLSVEIDTRGNVKTERHATRVPGIFAAGDAFRGQSLIVWAISDGREAAREIDTYLLGHPSDLPTRGRDLPFIAV
jgi:glutamate synthase (NADPH/NADH) small chain